MEVQHPVLLQRPVDVLPLLQKKGLVLGFVEGIHLLDPEGLFASTVI